jgi:uncharacterized protein YhaN
VKIREIECERFAGVKDRDVEFESGMNVLVGDNETGKSTLVDLIYHMLFQDTKLHKTQDKKFLARYFPTEPEEGGAPGDVIDGKLYFETSQGKYVLTKEWELEGSGSCKLKLPNSSIIKSPDQIKKELQEALVYGRGIYDEVIFSSQLRNPSALMNVLGTSEKTGEETKKEISAQITRAVAEHDGIALDKLGEMLKEKVKLYGERWNLEQEAPEGGIKRGITNKWKTGKDKALVLTAYYACEEVRSERESARQAEKNLDAANQYYRECEEAEQRAKKKMDDFAASYRELENRKLKKEKKKKGETELRKYEDIRREWPESVLKQKKAEKLITAERDAELLYKHNRVETFRNELAAKEQEKKKLESQDGSFPWNLTEMAEELEQVRQHKNKIERLKSRAAGMDISAKLKKFSDCQIQILSSISGEELDTGREDFEITEPVVIRVPDFFELELAPKGIEPARIREELQKEKDGLAKLYEKYGVSHEEELRKIYQQCQLRQQKISKLQQDMDGIVWEQSRELGDLSWEELSRRRKEITTTESVEEVKKTIHSLCGDRELVDYNAMLRAKIEAWEGEYHSLECLDEKIENVKSDLKEITEELESCVAVSEDYEEVQNPEEYKGQLEQLCAEAEEEKKRAFDDLMEVKREQKSFTVEEKEEELEKKEEIFREELETYKRWLHILQVYEQTKEECLGNPMEDMENNFRFYLEEISGENVHLQGLNETMDARLVSGGHYITYDQLSEGTKDTVALAFRLALLNHLFPEGGAVAVFDDSFVDMDDGRCERACKMLREFAEKNQVIFITCNEKYVELLQGNRIGITG